MDPQTEPRDFVVGHFAGSCGEDSDQRVLGRDDLLKGGGARTLAEEHRRLVARGESPQAAAKYLAGWFGGMLAESLATVCLASDAGLLVDETVRWVVHPEGWPECVDAARCELVVATGHPWQGRPGVVTVPELATVREVAMGTLVDFLDPLISACHGLAKVGRTALWGEVADGLGLALASSPVTAETPGQLERLQWLLALPSAPWRARPKAWMASGAGTAVVVGQKGGCCLAFTGSTDSSADAPPRPPDEDDLAYLRRFPPGTDEVDYCLTCSLRTRTDAEARQLFWAERRLQLGDAPAD